MGVEFPYKILIKRQKAGPHIVLPIKIALKSIKIAKKTGSAIAIGHPYAITIKVLNESKHLLEGLNLVYLNEIPVN